MQLNLTKNEKFVLSSLIDDGRATDSSIAKKLKISVQAVRKIRKKLESKKVIKRYSPIIDYEKMGIRAFAIVQLKLTEKGLKSRLDLFKSPNIIGSFSLPGTTITNIFIAGFSSLETLDTYFAAIRKKYAGLVEIQKMDIFSNIGLMKNSPSELIKEKIKGM
ncbi:winged helix-turn-helix transcriptional regulator [Candidatus Woesearchaeota archaeon]|nr:winged helix-turn-helix transcriptional regulator [Candidatus Woesearchaeota archaeon]